MEKIVYIIIDYLLQVGLATAIQLFVLLGPLLVLALLMNLISSQIRKLAPNVFGYKTFVYGFKWLGTPVHEIGHALFALIFAHKITAIKLFDPDATDGSYGCVEHSYKPGNIYQETGRFFIGIGPVLMGSFMLYMITWLLFRFSIADINQVVITSSSMTHLSSLKTVAMGIAGDLSHFLTLIFLGPNTAWWKILLLAYFLFSIGSSMTLSSSDIKGALAGFLFFVLILFIFNLLTLWIGNFAVDALSTASTFFSGFYFLMVLSIIINRSFVIVLALLNPAINGIRRKIRG